MGVNEVKPEQLLAAKLHVEENTSESRITNATDFGTCDLEDKSLNSNMFKRKSQGTDSVSKGQRTKQTIAPRQADNSRTAGNESKGLSSTPVTKTKKVSGKNAEVKIPRLATSHSAADQSDGSSSSATSQKSKIPVRSTLNAEFQSPVVADKTGANISSTIVTLKSEKTEENREASLTKSGATKSGAKHLKEKSEVGSRSVNLVNGLVNDHVEVTVKVTHPPSKKDSQKNLDCSEASSTSNSRLPVSVQARKKNQDPCEAGRTDSDAVPESKTERSETEQGADQRDQSPGKTKTTDASPAYPESPHKGKTNNFNNNNKKLLLKKNTL